MTWVRRAEPVEQCRCNPPMRDLIAAVPRNPYGREKTQLNLGPVPDGHPGDLWRCDTCHQLWHLRVPQPQYQPEKLNRGAHVSRPRPEWQPASWWQRWRYRHTGRTNG